MLLDSLLITNLGFFGNKEIKFSQSEINIIQGANATGKTTLLSVIYSMFQDVEKMEYEGDEPARILLKLKEGQEELCLEKYYKNGTAKLIVPSIAKMKRIASLNCNSVYIFSGDLLKYDYKFKNIMVKNAVDLLKKNGYEDDEIFEKYFNFKGEFQFISEGMQSVIRILNMLYYIPDNSVLLLDDPFAMLDINSVEMLLTVMRKLQTVQIILSANMYEGERIQGNKIYLERDFDDRFLNYPHFKYKEMFAGDMKRIIHNLQGAEEQRIEKSILEKQDSEPQIVKYVLGEEVEEIENRNIEFKEVKGINPCNSIISTAEVYINAFLNSRVAGIGIIKWGITNEGIVKGVHLSKKDMDMISRRLSEQVGQMKPYVSADILKIEYEKILNGEEIEKDLYIVEVIVKSRRSDILFSTAKGEVYIKTEGGRQKLDAQGIQNELIMRWNLKNNR